MAHFFFAKIRSSHLFFSTFGMNGRVYVLLLCSIVISLQINSCFASYKYPDDWKHKIEKGNRLYSEFYTTNVNKLLRPSIGNGYIATVVSEPYLYVGGLFNGRNINGAEMTPTSHRAAVPLFINYKIDGLSTYMNFDDQVHSGGFAMDIEEGVFYGRQYYGKCIFFAVS